MSYGNIGGDRKEPEMLDHDNGIEEVDGSIPSGSTT